MYQMGTAEAGKQLHHFLKAFLEWGYAVSLDKAICDRVVLYTTFTTRLIGQILYRLWIGTPLPTTFSCDRRGSGSPPLRCVGARPLDPGEKGGDAPLHADHSAPGRRRAPTTATTGMQHLPSHSIAIILFLLYDFTSLPSFLLRVPPPCEFHFSTRVYPLPRSSPPPGFPPNKHCSSSQAGKKERNWPYCSGAEAQKNDSRKEREKGLLRQKQRSGCPS